MSKLIKFLIVFLVVALSVFILNRYFAIEFRDNDYWDYHGVLFLFFITLFPRLTLLFSSVASGGIFWWLGWIFTPRLLVALLATLNYWNQNPFLVVISWLVALGGESSEKVIILKQARGRAHHFQRIDENEIIDVTPKKK